MDKRRKPRSRRIYNANITIGEIVGDQMIANLKRMTERKGAVRK